jgi:hypothetical protein
MAGRRGGPDLPGEPAKRRQSQHVHQDPLGAQQQIENEIIRQLTAHETSIDYDPEEGSDYGDLQDDAESESTESDDHMIQLCLDHLYIGDYHYVHKRLQYVGSWAISEGAYDAEDAVLAVPWDDETGIRYQRILEACRTTSGAKFVPVVWTVVQLSTKMLGQIFGTLNGINGYQNTHFCLIISCRNQGYNPHTLTAEPTQPDSTLTTLRTVLNVLDDQLELGELESKDWFEDLFLIFVETLIRFTLRQTTFLSLGYYWQQTDLYELQTRSSIDLFTRDIVPIAQITSEDAFANLQGLSAEFKRVLRVRLKMVHGVLRALQSQNTDAANHKLNIAVYRLHATLHSVTAVLVDLARYISAKTAELVPNNTPAILLEVYQHCAQKLEECRLTLIPTVARVADRAILDISRRMNVVTMI